MTRIGLISDTHGYLDPAIFDYFKDCHEIWHAGDFGNIGLAETLVRELNKPLRGVYGNIDDKAVRNLYPETLFFECEQVKIWMRHIGGYPGRYAPGVKKLLQELRPHLMISGHSHIVKIMPDPSLHLLHINPGAAGKQGWHTVRTLVRLTIDKDSIHHCELIELGNR